MSFIDHNHWMRLALELSLKGRFTAPPNPWVGCIVVHNETIISEGWHEKCGTPHAEAIALEKGPFPPGSVLYSTLEPCVHVGKTPACTEAIIRSGIKTVVIGILDPDKRVRGRGIKQLQEAGIHVTYNVLKEEIEDSLYPYIIHRTKERPSIILRAAVSLDGKIATKEGISQWISSPLSRDDAHLLRAESQAILVGAETVILDNPRLTCRLDATFMEEARVIQPLRIVLDRHLRTPPKSTVYDIEKAPSWIITYPGNTAEKKRPFEERGVKIIEFPEENFLKDLVSYLAKQGVLQLLIEGGGAVIDSFFKENLYDQIILYLGPVVLGNEGRPWIHNPHHLKFPEDRLSLVDSKTLGDTIRLRYLRPELNIRK